MSVAEQLSGVPAPARAALERLVASPPLLHARRTHSVLTYLVQELLAERAGEINEQRIAEAVFGRGPEFNPAEDNIVRVTVGHLRARLDEYYAGEGRDESWLLEIPKGRYVPALRLREPDAAPVLRSKAPQRANGRSWSIYLVALLVAANVLLALLLVRARLQDSPGHGQLAGLFPGRNTPVTIVVTDENLMAYRAIFGKVAPLSSYMDRSFARPPEPPATPTESRAWGFVGQKGATSSASAGALAKLSTALEPHPIIVRHPAELSTPDLETGNVVLLGGPWVNPWVQLFEDRLDFRTVIPPGSLASEIQDVHSEPGGAVAYKGHFEGGIEVSYLRLALTPNLRGSGRVLLIGGIRGPSQEAGANYLTDPRTLEEILRRFGAASASELRDFELLLEAKGVLRTPTGIRIIAQRSHASQR